MSIEQALRLSLELDRGARRRKQSDPPPPLQEPLDPLAPLLLPFL
jgi:hypothetical protein